MINKRKYPRYKDPEKGKRYKKEYMKKYRNTEKNKKYQKEYYVRNKERYKNQRQSPEGLLKHRKWGRAYDHRLKMKAYEKLGGKCVSCGCGNIRVLQIDHINGGGKKEIEKIGISGIRKRVLRGEEGYQLLCANCNWVKSYANHENRVSTGKQARYRSRLRKKAIEKLGGRCCQCGQLDFRVLQIHHMNGGGTKELRKLGTCGVMVRVLRNEEGYQLLCANCNWAKRYENNEV